jgi:arsenite/tail-anchored protein-transporting ATPase
MMLDTDRCTTRRVAPTFLEDLDLRLIIFGGKGGVGKTTAASAAALYRAKAAPDRKVLVVSTDPAHSLGDSFDQPVGDAGPSMTPTRITGHPNLFALEVDAERRADAFMQVNGDVLRTIVDRGTFFDQEDITQFFELSLPGLDELMAVLEITQLIHDRSYDLVVLDTAPTGHTLRLLELPDVMVSWIETLDLMLKKHRYMASVFGRYRPDEVDAFLERLASELGAFRRLLRDTSATEFVPVTIPESMSVSEMTRLLATLKQMQIGVRSVVVNRVLPAGHRCPYCLRRHANQIERIVEMAAGDVSWQMVKVPWIAQAVQGQSELAVFAAQMAGTIEPATSEPVCPDACCSSADARAAVGSGGALLDVALGPASAPIAPPDERLLLFGGKGGVGKTSVASATAIHLAQSGGGNQRVLIFSTDPAHSLSDSFEQSIGDRVTPIEGVNGLFALEMDSNELLAELKEAYVGEINEVFDAFLGTGGWDAPFDRQVMESLISMTPPGLDELMALIKIMTYMDEGEFDRYILDLAPTGHALRFLEMPDMARKWMISFFRLLLKYQGVAGLTQVAGLLLEKSKQLRRVEKLLADQQRSQFVAVTIPEAMSVLETRRLLDRMQDLSVGCRWVVVNMVMPKAVRLTGPPGGGPPMHFELSSCPLCATIRETQRPNVAEIAAWTSRSSPPLGVTWVPAWPDEIHGLVQLQRVADVLFGGSQV